MRSSEGPRRRVRVEETTYLHGHFQRWSSCVTLEVWGGITIFQK